MLMAVILCLLPIAAHAQSAPQDGQLVPGVINLFTSLNLSALYGAAEYLFWKLAIIGLLWSMVVLLFRRADIAEFFFELVSFTLFTGLFYWLLTQASDSSGLISIITNSFKQLGGDLAQQAHGSADLTASGNNIVNMGLRIFNAAVNQTDGMEPGEQMMLFTVALLVLGALALIGTQVVLVLIMAWMLAYGGIFLLGFGGSRWTSLIAISYYKHAIAVGIAMLGLMVIVAFGEDALYGAMNTLVGGTAIDMYTLAQMLVFSLIMMVLSIKVPSLLYRMVTGSQLGLLAGTATMAGRAISTGSGAIYSSVYNSATQAFNDYRAHYYPNSHDRSDQRAHIEGASAVVRASAVEAIRHAAGGMGIGDAAHHSMNMPQYNAAMSRVTPAAVSAADGHSGSVFTHAGSTNQQRPHAATLSAQASSAAQMTNSQARGDGRPATSNAGVPSPAGSASAGTAPASAGLQESMSRQSMQAGASSAVSVAQTQSAASNVSGAVAADMAGVREQGGMSGVGGAATSTSAARAAAAGGFQPNIPTPQMSSGKADQGSPRAPSDGVSNQKAGVAAAATGAAMAAAGAVQSTGEALNMPNSTGSSGKPGQVSPRASIDGTPSQKADTAAAAVSPVQAGAQLNMPVAAETSQKPGGGFQSNMSASTTSGISNQGLPRTSPDASAQKATTTVAGAGAAQLGVQTNMPSSAETSQQAGGGFKPNALVSSSPSGRSDPSQPRTSSDASTQKAATTMAGAGAAQAGAQPDMPVSASQKASGGFQPNTLVSSSSSGRSDQGLPRTSPDASTQKASTTVTGAGVAQSGTMQWNMPVSRSWSGLPSSGFQPNLLASQALSSKSSPDTPRMSLDTVAQKAGTVTTAAGTTQGSGVSSQMPVTVTSSQKPSQDLLRSDPGVSTPKAVSPNRTLVQDDQPSQVVSRRPIKSWLKRRVGRNRLALKREAGKTSSPADSRNPRKDGNPAKDNAKPGDRGKAGDAEPSTFSKSEIASGHERQSSQPGADTDGD
jgi:type IV secretion system protein TrbL